MPADRRPDNTLAKRRRGARLILKRLTKLYADIGTALSYTDPWQLLVATVLSAQTTDENVNKVAFEVRFSRQGGRENMNWTGGQGGPDVVFEKEPYATTMQKLTIGIVKWLPIESQL